MKKILCLICLFSVSFYSCAVRNYLSSKSDLNEDRVFYGQMINKGQNAGWFNVPAHLVRSTEHLAIYVQTKFHKDYQGEQNVSLYALNKLAQEFDYYYTSMTNIYGTHSDIDGNGKIIILLMDINVNKGAGSQVLGYFNPMDMHGYNEGEILYMDISNANNKTDNAIGTIIHEFQHLINYSYVISGERNEMSSWLNEALSESTSILFNKTTAESRIEEFNKKNYYCFYTWNAPEQKVTNETNGVTANSTFNYPSASVFMHWLYQKNGSNGSIFQTIASPKGLSDYNKVLSAAKEISGLSGATWDSLLLNWMSEIVTNGLATSWNPSVKATNNLASGDVSLYPGAMIVCDNYTNGASGNIVKTNVNNKTIVLNKDTTLGKGATSVKVSVSSTSSKARTRRSAIRNDNNEESRDINILLDRNGNIKKD
ncbi:peptidase M30, hyicolysin [Brachyspira aalborgi]|uniref:peptidase M30, hyicolysin n=1 Tax=Brachyspira aalborgi TaxID=29522 RepID=UPI0011C80EE1|nr:peptidase M30, hyicolysin [Brachyspira aalborgi]TXJ48390.1 peptidase M30, hyicolysin [Brachyspira aalborgi]